MSRVVNISSAVTVDLTSYSSNTFTSASSTTNGVNSSANTSNYASYTANTRNTDAYAYYVFGSMTIPPNATISSVSCTARGFVNNSSRGTAGFQLLANNTAKGSETTFTNTSSSAITLTNTGTWTVNELTNTVKLRIRGTRTSSSNYFRVRFNGASLGVNYTVPQTYYEISVNNTSLATVSPSSQEVESGGSATITFSDIEDTNEIIVKDNGTDVTSSLTPVPGQSSSGDFVPSEYITSASTYDSVYTGSSSDGLEGSGSTSRFCVYANTGANAVSKLTYKFNCSSIPQNAIITSVSCVAGAACYSNGQYFATRTLQLYNGDTAKGSAVTITGNGGTKANHNIDGGSWTRSELDDIRLVLYIARGTSNVTTDASFSFWGATLAVEYTLPGSGYQYVLTNVATDHTITVEDSGPATYYNVNATSSYSGATVTPSTQSIREGRTATVDIAVDNLYEITVKDNGTNVTNSLVENATGCTYTVSNVQAIHNITVEEATNYSVTTTSSFAGASAVANPTKVYAGRSSVVIFTFDHLYEFVAKDNGTVISVPEPVPATTVEYVPSSYNSSASNHGAVYNNSTGNGLTPASSTTYCQVSSNTAANSESLLVYNFDCSAIPQNAVIDSISCSAKGSASTSYFTTRTFQLYAGETAKGSPVTFSNNTVQSLTPGTWTREELNDIRIVERVVRGTSTTNQRFRFDGATLTVTYSVPASYTINNVQESHTITIEEAPYYGVTIQNSYAGATFSVDPVKIYSGRDAVVTININDIDEIHVFDNGVNIDASIVSAGTGVYTYTLTNVTAAHTISTTESTKYALTATSNYTGVTISPALVNTVEGKNQVFTLEPHDESIIVAQDVILLDNNVDVTNQLVTVAGETGTTTGVLGTFDPDMSSYVGIYNNYNYTNAEGNTVEQAYVSTSSTRSSFYTATGAGETIMVVYNLDLSSIVIPDGASIVNVSCQSVNSIAYSGQGFTEITSQLYCGTQPRGTTTIIKESSATTMQDASAHTYTTDGGSGWTLSDLSQAKIALFGTRNNTNSNNDSTGIRDNVNFHGADVIVTYALTGGCTYTVNNVQGTHTLVVNEKPSVTYNITCQSLYAGATISPSSAQVKQGRSLSVHIEADHLYEFVVKDNGVDVTTNVTGYEGSYTYLLTGISETHSIVVEEGTKYAISASSTYESATIAPASMDVYKGQSGLFEIETPSLNLITLEDNGYDVTNNIVFVSGETFEVTGGTLGTFDADNSDYLDIYNNYAYTNAEGHSAAEGMASSSSTRSSFYPATGSGETVTVVYNIDTSQISLPADTVIVGVTSNVVLSVAFSGQGYSYVTAQLYSGLEPMGEPTVVKETANLADAYAHEYTVHGGPGWTLNDLSQVKIHVYGIRNDTNSSGDTSGKRDNVNIHGADLIVHYNYITAKTEYTYAVENVTTAHTLVLRQVQQCNVSTTSHLQNVSISSSTQSALERDSVTITITGDLDGVILMDNGVDVTTALVFDGESAATYTIMNIHGDHTVVATAPSLDADYIKTGGEFKRVKGYWKKVNGTWTLISREAFGESVTNKLVFYGGLVEYQEVGEVTKSGDTISLAISNNALPTGETYTLLYEDASRNPIGGIDKITDFTL